MALDGFEKYQIENLINHLRAIYPNELDESMLEQLKKSVIDSNAEVSSLTREITSLFKGDKNKLESFLTKYHIAIKNLEQVTEKVEQEVRQALNMSEITDFTKNGRTYIKITYGNGHVQMIENRNHKDTKQIFEDIQKIKALNNLDGMMNAEEAFRELLKDYTEVPLENAMFMNQERLNVNEQSKLNFVQMNFPHNVVLASVEENIFIIKGNPDITIEVEEKNGKYSLRQIGEATYGVKNEKNDDLQTDTIVERPNDIKQEYSVEELKKITEGMTEEEIVEYLRIHGKNPSQIMMILLSLEESKAATEKEQEKSSLEKPKQMVLKNSNVRGRMAAFVDILYLVFLVGMISGATFFAMLRFILQSL